MNRGLVGYPQGRGQNRGLGFPIHQVRGEPFVLGGIGSFATASASLNTKGNWVEMARTRRSADGFWVTIYPSLAAVNDMLFDIGLGGDPPHQIIVTNCQLGGTLRPPAIIADVYFPLAVPPSVPVMARLQSTDASATLQFSGFQFVSGEPYRSMRCARTQTYGINTADSGGTSLDPGGVAGVKGAWVELSPQTIDPIRYVIFSVGTQNNADRGGEIGDWYDLGYGSPGSEQIAADNMFSRQGTGTDAIGPSLHARWVNIPAGVRLVARKASGSIDAVDRLSDGSVMAFGP